MQDKEQIICKYKFQDKEKFDGKPYCTCFCKLCEDLPLCDDNCQIYEDFKQLARKTQECESLKSQLDFAVQQKECFEQLCEALKSEGFTRESLITEQENEIDELKHENEELKKQIKQLKDTIKREKEAGYSIIERLL